MKTRMTTTDGGTVIPFGKHQGRTIEELLVDDPEYLQWLSGQDWFRTKFVLLHQVIINRGAESAETPEHNALQVLFLDDEFCLAFARHITDGFRGVKVGDIRIGRTFEHRGIDVTLGVYDKRDPPKAARPEQFAADLEAFNVLLARRPAKDAPRDSLANYAIEIGVDDKRARSKYFDNWEIDRQLDERRRVFDEQIKYLDAVAEERWREACGTQHADFAIEIKPMVGDDYPAVLRQMLGQRTHGRMAISRDGCSCAAEQILFLDRYTGTGATREQFIQTFAASNIKVVFKAEVKG